MKIHNLKRRAIIYVHKIGFLLHNKTYFYVLSVAARCVELKTHIYVYILYKICDGIEAITTIVYAVLVYRGTLTTEKVNSQSTYYISIYSLFLIFLIIYFVYIWCVCVLVHLYQLVYVYRN